MRMPVPYRFNSGAGEGAAAIHWATTCTRVDLSLGFTTYVGSAHATEAEASWSAHYPTWAVNREPIACAPGAESFAAYLFHRGIFRVGVVQSWLPE